MNKEVKKSCKIIRTGGVILYPTDTIWGLGCDATNQEAVEKIYGLKKRVDSKSMLILVPDTDFLQRYISSIPEIALKIMEEATRPTTIIYPGAVGLAENLLAEDGSVGIRISSDPFCNELMYASETALVSTSANISGEPSPAHFAEIAPELLSGVDHVVNWRQDERTRAQASAIIKINPDNSVFTIRA